MQLKGLTGPNEDQPLKQENLNNFPINKPKNRKYTKQEHLYDINACIENFDDFIGSINQDQSIVPAEFDTINVNSENSVNSENIQEKIATM